MASTTITSTIGSGTPLPPERATCSSCLIACTSVLYWLRRSSSVRFSSTRATQTNKEVSGRMNHRGVFNVLLYVTLACTSSTILLVRLGFINNKTSDVRL